MMPTKPRIYINVNHDTHLTNEQRAIKRAIIAAIASRGLDPSILDERGLPDENGCRFWHARSLMSNCDGVVVLAFAKWRDAKKMQGQVFDLLSSEFNHFERGLTFARILPLLIVTDQHVRTRGITYTGGDLKVCFWPENAGPEWAQAPSFTDDLDRWVTSVRARHFAFLGYSAKKTLLIAFFFLGLCIGLSTFFFFFSPDGTLKTEKANSIPAFPWPPPPASAETMIPRNWLSTTVVTQLADVADRLDHALNEARYPRWSYSSVPNGFALVSQIEQIKSDGTPTPEPERWSTDMPWVTNMTLLEFIKALTNAQPGFYRVIVFIVNNQPWSRTCERPTGEEAKQWLAKGFNWLPQSIGELTYGHDYRTTALVYEFKKVSRDSEATFLAHSLTPADDHLKKAGIANPLSRL